VADLHSILHRNVKGLLSGFEPRRGLARDPVLIRLIKRVYSAGRFPPSVRPFGGVAEHFRAKPGESAYGFRVFFSGGKPAKTPRHPSCARIRGPGSNHTKLCHFVVRTGPSFPATISPSLWLSQRNVLCQHLLDPG
jgi:hypothetical protein